MEIQLRNGKPSELIDEKILKDGNLRQVVTSYILKGGVLKLVWEWITAFIFTSDGFGIQTKDGYIIKCKDQ